jgi:hypothetical protein
LKPKRQIILISVLDINKKVKIINTLMIISGIFLNTRRRLKKDPESRISTSIVLMILKNSNIFFVIIFYFPIIAKQIFSNPS